MKREDDWRKHFHADGRIKDPRETLVLFGFWALAIIFAATVAAALVIVLR